MRLALLAAFLGVLPAACSREPRLVETSDVCRVADQLLFVSDDDPGGYYVHDLGAASGPLVPIEVRGLSRVVWPSDLAAPDPEAIGVLADGRVVVLSEDDAALVAQGGRVAVYDDSCREVAGRGLEGLAVRPLADGASRVAVLWEGGYLLNHRAASGAAGGHAFSPFVVVHDVPPRAGGLEVTAATSRRIPLAMPHPAGEEPAAQRFRAPALVWHRLGEGSDDAAWGFIVLLSSENGAGPKRYQYHWIQRFDGNGTAVGEPLDLDALVPDPTLRGRNWEGLAWFEPERSLIAVYENTSSERTLNAFVIEMPEAWRIPLSP